MKISLERSNQIILLAIVLQLIIKIWLDIGSTIAIQIFAAAYMSILLISYVREFRKLGIWEKVKYLERFLVFGLILMIGYNIFNKPFSSLGFKYFLGFLVIYQILIGILLIVKRKEYLGEGLERILGTIFLLGFLLRYHHWPIGVYFITIGAQVLFFYYLYIGIRQIKEYSKTNYKIASILVNVGLGLLILSVNFSQYYWPGYKLLLIKGFLLSMFGFILFIIKKEPVKGDLISTIFNKFRIYLSISIIWVLFTPRDFAKLDFGIRPRLIDAYFECQKDWDKHGFGYSSEACQEFNRLNHIWMYGDYPEGNEDYINEYIDQQEY